MNKIKYAIRKVIHYNDLENAITELYELPKDSLGRNIVSMFDYFDCGNDSSFSLFVPAGKEMLSEYDISEHNKWLSRHCSMRSAQGMSLEHVLLDLKEAGYIDDGNYVLDLSF